MSAGFVYILVNEAMPDYVKTGLTSRERVEDRVAQLDNTSVPMPFELYYAAKVPDCARFERTLHFVFGEARVRKNREFFKIEPDLAKAIIDLVKIEEEGKNELPIHSLSENNLKGQEEKESRRPNRTFQTLNIPVGSQLTFVKDSEVTCSVHDDRSVLLEGEIYSPTRAALIVINRMGYDWSNCSGMEYWRFEGRKLSHIQPLREPSSFDIEN